MSRMTIQLFGLMGVAIGVVAAEPQYRWRAADDCLALISGEQVLWQLNFRIGEGKPFFHPLTTKDGTVLTAARPEDHPWHFGLWWSWKYINDLNYWEEERRTGRSPGVTEVVSVQPLAKADHSARVAMDLSYHPSGKPAILKEKRVLWITAPDARGNYSIVWDSTFTACAEALKFDRTPPAKGAGGYAGLGLRFSAGTRGWTFAGSEGKVGAKDIYGTQGAWVDFQRGHGVAVLDHPQNPRHPTLWYPNEKHPFLCAAFLFKEPYELAAGKTLRLRYLVLVHSEPLSKDALQQKWLSFSRTTPNDS
ncbi:MAG: PmoA family protein [Verrucomicrobiota bacterium]